jgi:hypothetical protein
MARHKVKFRVPTRPLQHADIEFDVYRNGQKFGELHVSQGAVVWVPRDRTFRRRLSWEKLDELMRTEGKKRRA